MRSGISLAVSLVSASLLSIACARPLVLESTNDSAAICKRDLAADVARIQASTDYLVCQITEQIKETAIMIGMVGLTRRTCTPPGGATTTPAATTPAPIAAAVVQQPAAVSVPSPPKPPAAVLIPIPTTPSPTPLAATPATPKTTPVSAAPVVAAPSPVVAPAPQNVIVPISAGPTAADLNACFSTDADVCFEQAKALEAHNASRRKHHVPDLVWNHDLAAAAMKYALKAHWGHSHGSLFPSSYVYGENIYASTLVEGMADGLTTISTAIMAFTNEEVDYDYANPGYSDPTGHFTQVVWKDTREVGCAIVNVPLDIFLNYTSLSSYAVCEYYPSGNYNGQFAANVFAPMILMRDEEETKLGNTCEGGSTSKRNSTEGLEQILIKLREYRDDRCQSEELQQGYSSDEVITRDEKVDTVEDKELNMMAAVAQEKSLERLLLAPGSYIEGSDHVDDEEEEEEEEMGCMFGPTTADLFKKNRRNIKGKSTKEDEIYFRKVARQSLRGMKGVVKKQMLREIQELALAERRFDHRQLIGQEEYFLSMERPQDYPETAEDKNCVEEEQWSVERLLSIAARKSKMGLSLHFAQDSGRDSSEDPVGSDDEGANRHPLYSVRHAFM